MAGARGNKRGGGDRVTRSGFQTGKLGGTQGKTVTQLCGMCNIVTDDSCIGCDTCSKWYHPHPTCMGLPDSVITNIRDYGGAGVSYSCSECRISRSSESDKVPLKQMYESMKSLVETVNLLKNQVEVLAKVGQKSFSSITHMTDDKDSLKVMIHEEVREFREREKRESSLVFRGIEASNVNQANDIIRNVLKFVAGRNIDVGAVHIIDLSKKLFRGNLKDISLRRLVLDNANKLKESQYRNIYINRDLTYNQRQELHRRRIMKRNNRSIPAAMHSSLIVPNSMSGEQNPINVGRDTLPRTEDSLNLNS